MSEKIAVLGLGYVGLPVAVGFAEHFEGTIGFDINQTRIQELKQHNDITGEVESDRLAKCGLKVTDTLEDLKDANIYVACIPTPVNENKEPDLTPLRKVSESIAKVLSKGDIIVFESTVYPGVTEEICGPWLEELSGLKQGIDFKLGYSPERINPGDKVNTLETINKVVAGEDEATTKTLAHIYGKIITGAKVHVAPNIKVAEMSKVIENTQRDVNIALINEIAIICEKIGIHSKDVLEAAGTKWNFLNFKPGLVGGHCIGVDPYYLTAKARELGHHADVILSGRRMNDGMGKFVAEKIIKMMIQQGKVIRHMKVGVLGITFKENITDTRNTKVVDVIKELCEYGVCILAHDPYANPEEIREEYDIGMCSLEDFKDLDCLVYAVPHEAYKDIDFKSMITKNGGFVDIKSLKSREDFDRDHIYWSL